MDFKVTKINLDKERHIKLTFRGIREFQELTGADITKGNLEDLTPKEMLALVWVCLMWEDETLKIESIEELIKPISNEELAEKLMEGILNSMPEVKPETVPLATEELTGSNSGASRSTISNIPKFLSGT
jgi:hypothetical protein